MHWNGKWPQNHQGSRVTVTATSALWDLLWLTDAKPKNIGSSKSTRSEAKDQKWFPEESTQASPGHDMYYGELCLFRQIGLEIFTSLILTQVHSMHIKMKAEVFMPLEIEIYTHRHTHTHTQFLLRKFCCFPSQVHNISCFFVLFCFLLTVC